MPSPRNASTFSSFTTICSGVCFEIFLMVIHSARPHTARTTQNNPLTTNGPKNPDPSRCNIHLSGVTPLSDKPNHGQGLNHTRGHYTRYVALHPLRGAAPVTWRCTRYVALHPNRRGAMPTDRVHDPIRHKLTCGPARKDVHVPDRLGWARRRSPISWLDPGAAGPDRPSRQRAERAARDARTA